MTGALAGGSESDYELRQIVKIKPLQILAASRAALGATIVVRRGGEGYPPSDFSPLTGSLSLDSDCHPSAQFLPASKTPVYKELFSGVEDTAL